MFVLQPLAISLFGQDIFKSGLSTLSVSNITTSMSNMIDASPRPLVSLMHGPLTRSRNLSPNFFSTPITCGRLPSITVYITVLPHAASSMFSPTPVSISVLSVLQGTWCLYYAPIFLTGLCPGVSLKIFVCMYGYRQTDRYIDTDR